MKIKTIVPDQEDYQNQSNNNVEIKQIQDSEIISDAIGDNRPADLISEDIKHHKIPFDRVKRAVWGNLPCFYITFCPTNEDQNVPIGFSSADRVFEYLKRNNIQINKFSFGGWAYAKLKLEVYAKEDCHARINRRMVYKYDAYISNNRKTEVYF